MKPSKGDINTIWKKREHTRKKEEKERKEEGVEVEKHNQERNS